VSLYGVQRAIHELNINPAHVERFRADPTDALAEYPLDEAERTALVDGDLETLWRMGVHPLMMLHYIRARQIPGPELYRRIGPLQGLRHLVSAREG